MIRSPKTLFGQLFAYVFSGGAMTALHSAFYWTMAQPLHVNAYAANTISTLIVGIIGYLLHSRWTFGHTNNSGGGLKAQGRYVIVSALCYLLNSFWVWLMVTHLGLSVSLSILPMVLATPWLAFLLNRYWTFSH